MGRRDARKGSRSAPHEEGGGQNGWWQDRPLSGSWVEVPRHSAPRAGILLHCRGARTHTGGWRGSSSAGKAPRGSRSSVKTPSRRGTCWHQLGRAWSRRNVLPDFREMHCAPEIAESLWRCNTEAKLCSLSASFTTGSTGRPSQPRFRRLWACETESPRRVLSRQFF